MFELIMFCLLCVCINTVRLIPFIEKAIIYLVKLTYNTSRTENTPFLIYFDHYWKYHSYTLEISLSELYFIHFYICKFI